ncbi:hypothetical protein [Motilimonas pumila]|uniref:Uncharacterized protein n=1 Tax=Motilimonas pumila TaxID=2303987 RepID=A0A418YDA9_9GAMM|nr:hypothetical protein [Motilimonas pumila]RJG42513.1 hypothetical protein D1Z90_12670 [Motilimonas pumila]
MAGQSLVNNVLSAPRIVVKDKDSTMNINKTEAGEKLTKKDRKHIKTQAKGKHTDKGKVTRRPEHDGDIDLFV